jgi:membrane associated rhomboid family serine protease
MSATTSEDRFEGVRLVLALLGAMWLFELLDLALDHRLDQYGIEPRDPDGLVGVVAAPFLHAGFGHLIANSVPFVVLGIIIGLQGVARVVGVTAIVMLVSGVGTWLVGPENSIHIGASGVVFGYATYLLARGVFNRSAGEIAIGVGVALVWGTALAGGLVPQEGVSWQGHFFGAVGGVVAARVFARRARPIRPRELS